MSGIAWPLIAYIADGRTITEAEAAAIIDALRDRATPANATDTAGVVERFNPHEDFSAMSQNPDGRYVRYADFAALRAENERQIAHTRKWMNLHDEKHGWMLEYKARAEAAEAERDRLQAELRRIAEGNLGDQPWQANYDAIRAVAIAALTQTDRTGETDE